MEHSIPSYRFLFVNDFANVLDSSTEKQIISTARQLDDRTEAQVVVVTLPDLDDRPLEEYATGLFREWGIGSSKDNNGVLILLDVGGRQSRIEVGYGLEGILPDGKTGRIQDNWMIPYFQKGDYNQGILHGFDAIVSEVYTEYGIEYEGLADYDSYWPEGSQTSEEIGIPGSVFLIGIIVLIILIFWIEADRRHIFQTFSHHAAPGRQARGRRLRRMGWRWLPGWRRQQRWRRQFKALVNIFY